MLEDKILDLLVSCCFLHLRYGNKSTLFRKLPNTYDVLSETTEMKLMTGQDKYNTAL